MATQSLTRALSYLSLVEFKYEMQVIHKQSQSAFLKQDGGNGDYGINMKHDDL